MNYELFSLFVISLHKSKHREAKKEAAAARFGATAASSRFLILSFFFPHNLAKVS
ncbi:MAG: hypothetical protein IKP36_10625 [Bacteroidaceae bacterium]|nr:hypothetical protein [Bacteroidaceae bacterium]